MPINFWLTSGVTCLMLAAARANALPANGKPRIYNYAGKGSNPDGDAEMRAVYGKKFSVVDFTDPRKFIRPVPTRQITPRPLLRSGRVVEGKVRVIFIASAKGEVREPFVLWSTNPELNRVVLDAVKRWRGSPARLNGVALPMVFSQDFTFTSRHR